MINTLALNLVADAMKWDNEVATREYAWLRLISSLKYDGYSDFRAGVLLPTMESIDGGESRKRDDRARGEFVHCVDDVRGVMTLNHRHRGIVKRRHKFDGQSWAKTSHDTRMSQGIGHNIGGHSCVRQDRFPRPRQFARAAPWSAAVAFPNRWSGLNMSGAFEQVFRSLPSRNRGFQRRQHVGTHRNSGPVRIFRILSLSALWYHQTSCGLDIGYRHASDLGKAGTGRCQDDN